MGTSSSLISNTVESYDLIKNIKDELLPYFIDNLTQIIIEYYNGDSLDNYLWHTSEKYITSYPLQIHHYNVLDGDMLYYIYPDIPICIKEYNIITHKLKNHKIEYVIYNSIIKLIKDNDILYIITNNNIVEYNITSHSERTIKLNCISYQYVLNIKNKIIYHSDTIFRISVDDKDNNEYKSCTVKYYYNMITKKLCNKVSKVASVYKLVYPGIIYINETGRQPDMEILCKDFNKNIILMCITNVNDDKLTEHLKFKIDIPKNNLTKTQLDNKIKIDSNIFRVNILNFNCYEIVFEVGIIYTFNSNSTILKYVYVYDRINKKINRIIDEEETTKYILCRVSKNNVILCTNDKVFLYKRI